MSSLHKQFMQDYTSRALTADELGGGAHGVMMGLGLGSGSGAAAAGSAAAAANDEDADLSLKSVLRAIDDEEVSAPLSHAERVARAPVAPASHFITPTSTPQKAKGPGAAVPATPPNAWAFTKPAGMKHVGT